MVSSFRASLTRFAPLAVAALLTFTVAACAPRAGSGAASPGAGIGGDTVVAMNHDRAANGLGGLAVDGQLTANAQSWADHLAATGALIHTDLGALLHRPDMAAWWTIGENLLESSDSLSGAAAEALWMASPQHRANILNPAFNHVGVAAARDGAGRLWLVAEFGAR
jgi:uncharacterized protein YkwD